MKKILVAMLLCMSLLLTGCLPDFLKKPADDSPNTSDSGNTETPQTPATDTSYLDIERYDPATCAPQFLAIDGCLQALSLNIPTEWKLTSQKSGGYAIQRNKEVIGHLYLGEATDTDEWVTIQKKEVQNVPLGRARILERNEENGVVSFRYRFVYTLTLGEVVNTATLVADYAEVGENLARTLVADVKVEEASTNKAAQILADVPKQNILILGNSFINSSRIGTTLREMLNSNQKNVSVNAVSWGYANVATFINDKSTMNSIKAGQYDIVFICGFYEMSQSENLAVLRQACESSNTALVIFPAHNETLSTINATRRLNPDLACLDWRNELNMLIDGGIDRWDLCTDDAYDHSTPLAGYVGAHMIYRALYGAAPGEISFSAVDEWDLSVLGNYPKTGILSLMGKTNVIYLSE